jgi:ATP-dependent exoDNAse (exonuclease V) alpha subunit
VAIFWLQISSVQRSAGRRATASAAYRAGERLRDERSGEIHNHTRRRDVLHTEIFLPAQFEGAEMAWARNRERLWNTAEHTEKRYNARVAREFQVSLPAELDPTQRLTLARAFAGEIAERYRVAVDLAVHAPRPGSDPRHFHAHLLMTTREVTPLGLGAKTGLELSGRERRRRELPDHRQEFIQMRERWATLTNQALRDAHLDVRVDHRSLAAQGIDREPQPRIPLGHLKMEQRGVPSELAEHLRNTYRARVQQRLEEGASRASTVAAAAHSCMPAPSPAPSTDVETIRRQAREAWLRLRAQEAHGAQGRETAHETETPLEQARDDLAM